MVSDVKVTLAKLGSVLLHGCSHPAYRSALFCLSQLSQVCGFVLVTAAGFGGNYVKMCKSASRFTCLNISMNTGGACILQGGGVHTCLVQRDGKKKKNQGGFSV